MGVTVHCFAFDPARWSADGPPTVHRLFEAGALTDELTVAPGHEASLVEVPTRLGDNKRWYANLSAETIYDAARAHFADPVQRRAVDRLLRMLFWDPPESAPPDDRPVEVSALTYVYPSRLIERISSRATFDRQPLADAIRAAASSPQRPVVDHIHLWEPDWFMDWLDVWLGLFRAVRAAGPGWGLLMWVWV